MLDHLQIHINELCVGMGLAVEASLVLHPVRALGCGRDELQSVCRRVIELHQPTNGDEPVLSQQDSFDMGSTAVKDTS